MFKGTYTAIVTPFKNGKFDAPAFRRLIRMQIDAGVDGIVPVGTTGESPTLNYQEHIQVIERAVEFAAGKIKVIGGTGANSTDEAIFLTKAAEKAGVDASLQVTPYYNRPMQEGLFQHFRAVARATRLPIILYNVPSRCVVDMSAATVRRLAKACPNIVGIKESCGKPERVAELRAALGKKFTILSGDDADTLRFMAAGAVGVVSVASNVAPREVVGLVRAIEHGQSRAAAKLNAALQPLFRSLFLETNPIPVKAALAMMGLIEEEYRLPMTPISAANRRKLRDVLKARGLL